MADSNEQDVPGLSELVQRGEIPAEAVPHVRLEGALPEELFAYLSIAEDLRFCGRALDALLERPVQNPMQLLEEADVLSVALWNAALAAYGRCFTTGLRYAAASQLSMADPQRALHRDTIAVRDSHVAHLDRKAPSEAGNISLLVDAWAKPDPVLGIRSQGVKLLLPSQDSIRLLRELVTHLLSEAERAATDLQERIVGRVSAQATAGELVKMAVAGRAVRLDR